MVACQFKIPRYEWFSPNPRITKCILCEPRLREGRITGCAEACPTEATVFGDRAVLVAMARARIAAEPDKYHDHIYGLEEVGGTSVLFISPVPFEEIGFDVEMEKYPLPELTWRVLQHVPTVVLTGGIFLTGSYRLFKRRAEVRRAETEAQDTREDPRDG
jgi:formate dehydrogenase iron-sulfur subunit